MMTKITQAALAQPERSRERNRSANTVIRIQIQMKNRKNHSIDQKTWPVPNSDASVMKTFPSSKVARTAAPD